MFFHSVMYGTKSLDLEEDAQEATRKIATRIARKTTRKGQGKQRDKQHKYQHILYQNQNFISISLKNIVPLLAIIKKMKKNILLCSLFYIARTI